MRLEVVLALAALDAVGALELPLGRLPRRRDGGGDTQPIGGFREEGRGQDVRLGGRELGGGQAMDGHLQQLLICR